MPVLYQSRDQPCECSKLHGVSATPQVSSSRSLCSRASSAGSDARPSQYLIFESGKQRRAVAWKATLASRILLIRRSSRMAFPEALRRAASRRAGLFSSCARPAESFPSALSLSRCWSGPGRTLGYGPPVRQPGGIQFRNSFQHLREGSLCSRGQARGHHRPADQLIVGQPRVRQKPADLSGARINTGESGPPLSRRPRISPSRRQTVNPPDRPHEYGSRREPA